MEWYLGKHHVIGNNTNTGIIFYGLRKRILQESVILQIVHVLSGLQATFFIQLCCSNTYLSLCREYNSKLISELQGLLKASHFNTQLSEQVQGPKPGILLYRDHLMSQNILFYKIWGNTLKYPICIVENKTMIRTEE